MLKSELFSTKDAKVDKGSDICGRRRKKFLVEKFLLKERENKVLERFILDQNLLEELKKNYQIIQSFVSLASTISPTRLQVPI